MAEMKFNNPQKFLETLQSIKASHERMSRDFVKPMEKLTPAVESMKQSLDLNVDALTDMSQNTLATLIRQDHFEDVVIDFAKERGLPVEEVRNALKEQVGLLKGIAGIQEDQLDVQEDQVKNEKEQAKDKKRDKTVKKSRDLFGGKISMPKIPGMSMLGKIKDKVTDVGMFAKIIKWAVLAPVIGSFVNGLVKGLTGFDVAGWVGDFLPKDDEGNIDLSQMGDQAKEWVTSLKDKVVSTFKNISFTDIMWGAVSAVFGPLSLGIFTGLTLLEGKLEEWLDKEIPDGITGPLKLILGAGGLKLVGGLLSGGGKLATLFNSALLGPMGLLVLGGAGIIALTFGLIEKYTDDFGDNIQKYKDSMARLKEAIVSQDRDLAEASMGAAALELHQAEKQLRIMESQPARRGQKEEIASKRAEVEGLRSDFSSARSAYAKTFGDVQDLESQSMLAKYDAGLMNTTLIGMDRKEIARKFFESLLSNNPDYWSGLDKESLYDKMMDAYDIFEPTLPNHLALSDSSLKDIISDMTGTEAPETKTTNRRRSTGSNTEKPINMSSMGEFTVPDGSFTAAAIPSTIEQVAAVSFGPSLGTTSESGRLPDIPEMGPALSILGTPSNWGDFRSKPKGSAQRDISQVDGSPTSVLPAMLTAPFMDNFIRYKETVVRPEIAPKEIQDYLDNITFNTPKLDVKTNHVTSVAGSAQPVIVKGGDTSTSAPTSIRHGDTVSSVVNNYTINKDDILNYLAK